MADVAINIMFNIKSIFKFRKNSDDEKPVNVSRDPVCGMRPTADIDFVYEGVKYSFCSDHCKQQFEKDPKAYITK